MCVIVIWQSFRCTSVCHFIRIVDLKLLFRPFCLFLWCMLGGSFLVAGLCEKKTKVYITSFWFVFLASNNNNIFEIQISVFIENLARILYSREGVQCTGARRQGQGDSGESVVHGFPWCIKPWAENCV